MLTRCPWFVSTLYCYQYFIRLHLFSDLNIFKKKIKIKKKISGIFLPPIAIIDEKRFTFGLHILKKRNK